MVRAFRSGLRASQRGSKRPWYISGMQTNILSAVARLSDRHLLDEAKGRSKGEVEVIVARLHPQPDVPSSIRKLPEVKPAAAPGALLPAAAATPAPSALPAPAVLPPAPPLPQLVAPLAPDRYKV